MQITRSVRFLNAVADRRGWAKFSLLLDKFYTRYFQVNKQSVAALLKKKEVKQSGLICFICKGNVCRSPFVAEYLKSIDSRRNARRFLSAGLRTKNGRSSPEMILNSALEFGVDLSLHRTSRLTAAMVEKADLIVGMEPVQHIEFLLRFFKWRKKFLLLRAVEAAPNSLVVPDPLFKDEDGVRESFELLVKDGRLLLDALKQTVNQEKQ
jgi:protein-tyrosine phosphatase